MSKKKTPRLKFQCVPDALPASKIGSWPTDAPQMPCRCVFFDKKFMAFGEMLSALPKLRKGYKFFD